MQLKADFSVDWPTFSCGCFKRNRKNHHHSNVHLWRHCLDTGHMTENWIAYKVNIISSGWLEYFSGVWKKNPKFSGVWKTGPLFFWGMKKHTPRFKFLWMEEKNHFTFPWKVYLYFALRKYQFVLQNTLPGVYLSPVDYHVFLIKHFMFKRWQVFSKVFFRLKNIPGPTRYKVRAVSIEEGVMADQVFAHYHYIYKWDERWYYKARIFLSKQRCINCCQYFVEMHRLEIKVLEMALYSAVISFNLGKFLRSLRMLWSLEIPYHVYITMTWKLTLSTN